MRTIASKIYTREELTRLIKKLKQEGKTIGVTNGAFDILHAGHVQYLEDAKKQCDILVVSVNTDESVRLYKDPNRPINSQEDRAKTVAALESVDYVTFHNERRMRDTLLAFEPNFYMKGGDYNPESLTSKDVLEKWGGEVLFVPLLEGRSTSNTIDTIVHRYADNTISLGNEVPKEKQKVVIIDRDGVINEQVDYLHDPAKFRLLEGVTDALKTIQDLGYKLVIITNQQGIGLGYFSEEDFYKVNKKMLSLLHEKGISISKIYFCPHSLAENCNCRKPQTGLLERAEKDLNIDTEKSWMIGDRSSDILTGKRRNLKTIFVTTGEKENNDEYEVKPDYTATNLLDAANIVKQHS